MHRQPSRNAVPVDAVDCIVNTNDLAIENEVIKSESDQRRGSSSSRRDQTSKRSHESSAHRSTRHSPPSVTRKRHASPPPPSHHHHHHNYSSQRHHRVPSQSPSPPRHRRPVTSVKRPHSPSRSPYERKPTTTRSRPESSKEQTIDDVLMSISTTEEQIIIKKPSNDLSLISEDELTKLNEIRSNGTTTTTATDNKFHSTPSFQPNSNDHILEMSNISQDCELSLFAKSALSNTNSILATSVLQTNDLMQTIDLISKYKIMQALPCNDPQVEACSKEILITIQKQIELQKIEINHREREIKLRERELIEREKKFNERTSDTTSTASVYVEPVVLMKPGSIEEKTQLAEIIVDPDMKNVLQEESDAKSVPSTADTLKVDLPNNNGPDQPFLTRKNGGKSRFSRATVDHTIFALRQNPVAHLYSDDDDEASSSINANNSLKKPSISKILAPSEPIISIGDTELKVTSSNSCRKVEFQSGPIEKTATITTSSKGPSHDLRLTLSKNRTKQQNNDDNTANSDQIIKDDELMGIASKIVPSKSNSNKEDKQQSHDYHQQRSITSTSIETIIDNNNDKRDNRRQQQRTSSSRQQQPSVPNSSSTTINSNERSYAHGSASQQQSKYGSSQKRQENDDLRSRLFEPKHPKPSRTTHRNDY